MGWGKKKAASSGGVFKEQLSEAFSNQVGEHEKVLKLSLYLRIYLEFPLLFVSLWPNYILQYKNSFYASKGDG